MRDKHIRTMWLFACRKVNFVQSNDQLYTETGCLIEFKKGSGF